VSAGSPAPYSFVATAGVTDASTLSITNVPLIEPE
jgi:hypothetical protein